MPTSKKLLNTTSESHFIRLCINAKIPVFIIKYRIAPGFKFPSAVNDIINAYISILSSFPAKIKRIFLIGDSAGGNLVLSLTNFIIINKLELPSKLLLIYPGILISDYAQPKVLFAESFKGLQ